MLLSGGFGKACCKRYAGTNGSVGNDTFRHPCRSLQGLQRCLRRTGSLERLGVNVRFMGQSLTDYIKAGEPVLTV
jgi:hypothetical protein